MSQLIIERPDVQVRYQFGNIFCVFTAAGYEIYRVDRQHDTQERIGEAVQTPHEAWTSFWETVDLQVRKRLQMRFGVQSTAPWTDPNGKSHFIVNLQHPLINAEYRKRCSESGGCMDEEQRLLFDLDMVAQYSPYYPLPEQLRWKLKGIELQLKRLRAQKEDACG